MSNYKNNSLKIILFVCMIGIAGYKATSMHIEWLKYLAVLMQLYILAVSIKIIIHNKKRVNWNIAFPILAVISGYPFFYILFSNISDLGFKKITDGFFVSGIYYYQLPIVAMALALELTKSKYLLAITLYRYRLFAIPIAIFLTFYSIAEININNDSVGGFFVISDCIIPIALLSFFYYAPKKYYYLGWSSLLILLVFSSQIGARSYLLVSSYFIIALLIYTYKKSKKNFIYLVPIGFITIVVFILPTLGDSSSLREGDVTFMDKLQLDTLYDAVTSFLSTFDFSYLFYWEGNSRALILLHAFGDFTMTEWLFGRGMYGTYQSFIERSTIELGWAQESFFWGIPYVLLKIAIFISGWLFLRRQRVHYNNNVYDCLAILILVRFFDGFIYGMPEYTVYNVLVFCGVMMQTVKKDSWERLIK